MPTYLDPPKSHDHYGPEVQEALAHFQDVWKSYFNQTWIEMRNNDFRINSVQAAWNQLARARKMETGTGFYLNQSEYNNVVTGRLAN